MSRQDFTHAKVRFKYLDGHFEAISCPLENSSHTHLRSAIAHTIHRRYDLLEIFFYPFSDRLFL